DMLENEKSL
ncbi:hypothetical protein CISIN_1g0341711mg, partial [Citrus sinensis]